MARTERLAFIREEAKPSYRFRRSLAVIGFAVAGVLVSACGGSESETTSGDNHAGAADQSGSGSGRKVVHGDCKANGDVYKRGTVSVVDETGAKPISDEQVANLSEYLFLQDGPSGADSDVYIKPEGYSDELLNQVRDGIMELYESDKSVAGVVYLLGENLPDDDNYDGLVNKGVYAACVAWS